MIAELKTRNLKSRRSWCGLSTNRNLSRLRVSRMLAHHATHCGCNNVRNVVFSYRAPFKGRPEEVSYEHT